MAAKSGMLGVVDWGTYEHPGLNANLSSHPVMKAI
jgi:hypothetical protein